MLRFTVFLVALILTAGFAGAAEKAAGWYVIENYTNKCKADEGPTGMIKNLKALGQPYKLIDEKVENGKPVIVRLRINDGFESVECAYYRTKDLCKAALDSKKQKDSKELDRYK